MNKLHIAFAVIVSLSASLWAAKPSNASFPDLVAVKGGAPDQMFMVGIRSLGGMERFIKKGQTVLVKPNIGWNKPPEMGATTSPELVSKIIRMAYEAGAKEVWVFDHSVEPEALSQQTSGIGKAVKDSKGLLFPAENEADYREVKIPKAKLLKQAKVHRRFLDADVVINVPVLKDHAGSGITAGMKNLMGVVWDRRFWHREGLHQCIADFPLLRKVDLTVIDAFRVMFKRGPQGISKDDLREEKIQILSTDMLLADAASARVLGAEPASFKSLKLATEFGYGSIDLDKKKIVRISMPQ